VFQVIVTNDLKRRGLSSESIFHLFWWKILSCYMSNFIDSDDDNSQIDKTSLNKRTDCVFRYKSYFVKRSLSISVEIVSASAMMKPTIFLCFAIFLVII
jgi:hypothetical protein